jgi:hypothetical protein
LNNEFEGENNSDSNFSSGSSTQSGGSGIVGSLLGGGSSVLRSLFFKGEKNPSALPI